MQNLINEQKIEYIFTSILNIKNFQYIQYSYVVMPLCLHNKIHNTNSTQVLNMYLIFVFEIT